MSSRFNRLSFPRARGWRQPYREGGCNASEDDRKEPGDGARTAIEDRARGDLLGRLKARIESTKVDIVSIGSLRPNPRNSRKHPRKQIELLAKNFEKFGFHSPIVTDEGGMILCGHARVEAAALVGLDKLPVIGSTRKVNMTLSVAFLAPSLVKAAIEGRLPRGIGITRLSDPPPEWSRQYRALGLAPP